MENTEIKNLSVLGDTPEETKKNIVADLHKELDSENDAFGVAATMFGIYLPRFKGKIKGLGAKAVQRVLFALIETPLADKHFQPITPDEKEAFLIGQSLMEAKMLMVMHSIKLNEEKKMQEAQANPATENGESNGS